MPQRFSPTILLTAATTITALACFTAPSQAVQPGQWTHTTEADFAGGDPVDTVVTNLGDIRLTSSTTAIDGLPEDVTVVHEVLKTPDGVFVAAGPNATILMQTNDGMREVASFEGEQVFAMTAVGSQLIVGVSGGGSSRIVSVEPDEIETLVELPDVGYIWDLAWIDDKFVESDEIIIATGAPARVLRITEDDLQEVEVLLEAPQSNIISLATDTSGNVYAGTDTDGLVYRIDRGNNPFVLYDAPEAEVSALHVTDDGTVYAGTAAADQARPGRLAQPIDKETGRTDPQEQVEQPEPEQPDEPADEPAENQEPEAGADADDQAPAVPQEPTAEQYDALRDEMRQRLERARDTGEFDVAVDGGAPLQPAANDPAPAQRASRAQPAAVQKKQGNAVYQISPEGFVREVFRESSMMLCIAPMPEGGGKLLVTTGNEGQVFAVDPELGEYTLFADLDSAQVTTAVQTDQGLLLGGATPGTLVLLDQGMAEKGSFTSQVLDAGQISMFGVFKLTADIPDGTIVEVQLRSGNVGDPEQAAWSKWSAPELIESDPGANALQPREVKIDLPPARFLQYRLILHSEANQTPTVDQIDLAYISPNVPPQVSSLTITVPTTGEPGSAHDPNLAIAWQGADDNRDRLVYTLEYRPAGSRRYLTLAEDITETRYPWKTQHVPDGWYTVRVIASDKPDNPAEMARRGARSSEPVLVDNTAPTLENLEAKTGDGRVTLTATASDALSPIRSIAYSLNGSDQYQASLPRDLIYDSTSEQWSATISDLSPGEHVIAVRVIDARGNTAYRQVIVEVD
ncbi:MAG: hypothetical protein AAGH88_14060 [Planctomycetota bacterium]